MKTIRFMLVLSMCFESCLGAAGYAVANGPSGWMPFMNKDPQATIKKKPSSSASGFHKPAAVSKVQDSTKKLFTGGKSLFAPKKKPLGTGGKITSSYKTRASDDKPSKLKSLFVREKEPPKTIKEWMALKQVKP